MRRPIALAVLLAVGFGPSVASLRAEITAEQVRQAIDKGTGYLKRMQRDNGSWPDFLTQYTGGVTALCTLALLNSGVEPDDPHVRRALEYLRALKPDKTYTVSLQTMVFCQADPTRYKLLINRNVKWLESQQKRASDSRPGAW